MRAGAGEELEATGMTLSPEGLAKIAHNEGFQANAYPDHQGQSIGYGHLIQPGESFPGPITQAQAIVLLAADAMKAEADVNELVKVPLTQAQFDALVDFRYNLGRGPLINIVWTLNLHDYIHAGARMRLYNMVRVNGELVANAGLTARRNEEAKAFDA